MNKKIVILFLFILGFYSYADNLFSSKVNIPVELRTNILDIKKISKEVNKEYGSFKENQSKNKTKVNNVNNGSNLIIVNNNKKNNKTNGKLIISSLPYQFIKYKVYKSFGNIVEYKDNEGNIRVTSKDKLEKFYKRINHLINEYIHYLVLYKKAHREQLSNPYIEITFDGCSDLYPFYKDKIGDCFKLFNLLGYKDKKELIFFSINFLRQH